MTPTPSLPNLALKSLLTELGFQATQKLDIPERVSP